VLDLAGGRPLVQPALAALDVLEVLDRVGDVGRLAVDAGLGQRPVEDPPGRADERPALLLLVARLLADERDRPPTGPSPSTARVPPTTIGGAAAIRRLSSPSVRGGSAAAFSGPGAGTATSILVPLLNA